MRAGVARGATRSKKKERAAQREARRKKERPAKKQGGATRSKKKDRTAGQEKGGNPEEENEKAPCMLRDHRGRWERRARPCMKERSAEWLRFRSLT